MFSKLVTSLLLLSAFTAGVISKPIKLNRGLGMWSSISWSDRWIYEYFIALRTESHSFNNWGGHASLDHFDDFYGSNNFDGSQSTQVIVHDQQLVCHTEQIEVIQQRLVVLQEMAKRYGHF